MSTTAGVERPRDHDDSLRGFVDLLHGSGLRVPPAGLSTFLEACAVLGAESATSIYWAGRGALCCRAEDIPRFERVFERWFGLGPAEHEQPVSRAQAMPPPRVGSSADHSVAVEDAAPPMVVSHSSRREVLRHRDVATASQEERDELARLLAALTVAPPRRRSRRRHPARRGPVDVSRSVRDELARMGEPGPLRHRRRATRPRRVVLLVDVSGSMTPYAESFLRWSHRVVVQAPSTVEVFTLGTRLTRVTGPLRLRDADDALERAGRTVPDWSGGTRLGEALTAFLSGCGRRGAARGAVIVVFSDGLERGDTAELASAMAHLRRLAHRVLWVNPHRGKAGYEPVQAGMAAALPHIDRLVAGHSLAALEELTEEFARA